MAVEEYMPCELPSDSDNSRKMRQSEKRATKKRKLALPRNPFSTFSSAAQFHQSNVGNPTRPYTGNQFRNAPLSSQRQEWNPLQSNNFGRFQNPTSHCYNCGELGHWKQSCLKKNIIHQTRGQPQQDDKTDTDIKDKYFDLFDWLCSDQVLEENYFNEKEYSVKSNCSANPQKSIKGRLKNHLDYWEIGIGPNTVVTSVIKEGYKILFTYAPQKAYFKSNKSGLRNSDFVTDSIKDLLANKLVRETNNISHAVSPLSVAENSADKKRLILDLRYVNKHICTHKAKFDD